MKGIVLSKKVLAGYAVFMVMFAAQFAHAQSSISLGAPAYGGTGCPAELVPKVTISKGVISVRYNSFSLPDVAASRIQRANCSIRIPVNVNGRYRLAVENVELRGTAKVPAQVRLSYHADAGFVGAGEVAVDQLIAGPKGTHAVKLAQRATSSERTECGEDSMLSLNANMGYVKPDGVTGVRANARALDAKLVIEACN